MNLKQQLQVVCLVLLIAQFLKLPSEKDINECTIGFVFKKKNQRQD